MGPVFCAAVSLSPPQRSSGVGGVGEGGGAGSPAGAQPGAAPRAMRILVADDEDVLRMLLVEALRDEGLEVVDAADGEDALRLATAERFDALVLDHRMPGLTGGEVYEQLKIRGSAAPAILITAAREAAEIGASFGFKHVIAKPFDVEDLLVCLRRVTDGAG